MKEIKVTAKGKNYSSVSIGKLDDLRDFKLSFGPRHEVSGKVFVGQALGASGAEMSFQSFLPGEGSPFLHAHKTHEELYIVLKGEGEYLIDGKILPLSEGSIVRVAPAGKRALRNTGKTNMIVICIQYKANGFGTEDSPMGDGIIFHEDLNWKEEK